MTRRKTKELTSRQREILNWINGFIGDHGMPPTVREIADAFGMKSSSAFDHLKALERKGYLRRGELGARSLVIRGKRQHTRHCCVDVPIKGRVAAGRPNFAVEDDYGSITVDSKLVQGRPAYALLVEGDSMVGAGILDGDYVNIRQQDTADDSDIVVALIEDEATLKKFYHEAGRVRLEPANPEMQPIYVNSGEFRIQGKVVGVQRLLNSRTSFEKE